MDLSKHKYLVALSHFSKFGPVRLKKLKDYFPNFEVAFNANTSELKKARIEEAIASEFVSFRSQIDIETIVNKIQKENISVIGIDDENYPEILKEIFNPPQILYFKGELFADENGLAVVGSRNYTAYGQQIVEDIVRKVAKTGIPIISGLALGVDAHAHRVALEEGTRTIAVLGTGVDLASIYPSHNRHLAGKIVEAGGALISEFPIGTAPLPYHFPQRNRIISGLTKATLVVEAREKSGALITARDALEQNREIMAVPGSIYSALSAGPNKLIKDGAKAVLCVQDIFDSLDLDNVVNYIKKEEIKPETKEEEEVLKFLKNEPIHIDALVRLTKLDIKIINTTLSMMEIKGMIRNLGGMNYVLIK
ncbi:MAG: DNA-processing protein DprA [Patescibacteria group bacterium]|jgi:DNA processing protein|nr:DNA-processing protein DprA [Patescibacteria group bacterium]